MSCGEAAVGAITKNGALDPDRVAEMHGFKSGEEMLSQVLAAEGKTPYVKRRADEMMKEKKDSVVRGLGEDGVLAAEVDYHNEDRLAVLVAEAEMLRAGATRAKGNEKAQAKMLEAAAVRADLRDNRPRLADFLERIHARPAYRAALEKGGPYQLLG